MKINSTFKLIISIGVSQLAGIIGSFFSIASIPTWYVTLIKPALNPPNWIFGPVWITLYTLMGIAAFLVWEKGLEQTGVKKALYVFVFQLILNSAWSIIFFGLQNPALALVNIILLWLSIIWTMWLFAKISKPAMWLLLPYLLWVSFATYLNYSLWILN